MDHGYMVCDPVDESSAMRSSREIGAGRYDHRSGNDDGRQVSDPFRLMPAPEMMWSSADRVDAMSVVSRTIQVRRVGHFSHADSAHGEAVAKGSGVDIIESGGRLKAGVRVDRRIGPHSLSGNLVWKYFPPRGG